MKDSTFLIRRLSTILAVVVLTLTGGTIGTITVEHLYTLHSYVISSMAVVLAIAHLVGLAIQEQEIKQIAARQAAEPSIDPEVPSESRVPI
jgi:quinol-cytochrome oxidoreductase complex cytochrome b subunit